MGLETKIVYVDGVRFQVVARNHQITSDQPFENSGTDAGMTPPELLLGSLGSCAGYYAAEYLRTRSIPAAGLTVSVTAQKAQKPARLTDFRISLSVQGVDDQRHRDGILRAVKSCLIHNTLTCAATIQIELEKTAEVDQYQSELVAKH